MDGQALSIGATLPAALPWGEVIRDDLGTPIGARRKLIRSVFLEWVPHMTLPKTMARPDGRYEVILQDRITQISPLEVPEVIESLKANSNLRVRLVGVTGWTRDGDALLGWQVRRPGTAGSGEWLAAADVRRSEGLLEIWSVYSRSWMRYRAKPIVADEDSTVAPSSSGSKLQEAPPVSPLSSASRLVIDVPNFRPLTMIEIRPGTFWMGASDRFRTDMEFSQNNK